jgi:hypothetical protein
VLDPETFLVELYVLADEFCKTHLPPERRPGPPAALDRAEVVTLAVFGQWAQFPSEAAFYRWAAKRLRPLFPTLPSRPQFNRLVRRAHAALTAFALHLGQGLAAADDRAFEAIDGTGVRTRNAKRRGAGWLAGLADIGKCTRLGWYEGVRLLLAVTPRGAITGWGIGPASTNDRGLAETFFAARAAPAWRLPGVGRAVSDRYVADMGFSGKTCQARWARDHGAVVVSAPQTGSRRAWPKPLKTWLAGIRQVIESVNDRLLATFGLDGERPHDLGGLQARLAAKVGLHNVCVWLNRRLGRLDLAMADLIDW